MPDDIGILTYLLQQFVGSFSDGTTHIMPNVRWLLTALATIDITLAGLGLAMGQGDFQTVLLRKLLGIGFFVFIIVNFSTLISAVINGFVYLGLKAGGNSLSTEVLFDPSAIAGFGVTVLTEIMDHASIFSPIDAAVFLIAGIIVLFSFFIIAVQLFITVLEFYILSTLGLILIPFGVFKHTAFLAEKSFGVILSFGIKMMVLAFILSISMPIMEPLVSQEISGFKPLFTILLASLSIMMLCWQVPGLAAGMLAGAPSLSAATLGNTAVSLGASTAVGVSGGVAAAGYAKTGVVYGAQGIGYSTKQTYSGIKSLLSSKSSSSISASSTGSKTSEVNAGASPSQSGGGGGNETSQAIPSRHSRFKR